jgi:ATP-binding cassette subfamily F protein uup
MSILLSANELSLSFGGKPLFKNLGFVIESGEKIGLIGPNGAGKSSLLKMIHGELAPDAGIIAKSRNLKVSYLEQSPTFDPKHTIWDELSLALSHNHGGDTEFLIEKALEDFSLTHFPDPKQTLVHKLSGGEQKRVAIARECLRGPDIFLLDEPTNHLDVESILFLEKFIQSTPMAILMITHDRVFLQNTVNRIMELDRRHPQGLLLIKGDYAHYVEVRAQLISSQELQEDKLKNTLRREQEWLKRGAKARTTKQQARIKSAGELQEKVQDLSERNKVSVAKIDFKTTENAPKKLIEALGISKKFNNKEILPSMDLLITRDTRLGLLGKNGCGKSTLIKILLGQMAPDTGKVERAHELQVSYFEQSKELLNLKINLMETVCPSGDHVQFAGQSLHVKGYLARFNFSPEQMIMPVRMLSGGERARLILARMMLRPCQILILDEPTNDLDLATLNILEDVLKDFPGAIILVTHDRYFLDQIAKQILYFDTITDETKTKLVMFEGLAQWEDYRQNSLVKNSSVNSVSLNNNSVSKEKRSPNQIKKELERVQQRIEKLDSEIKLLELQLSSPEIYNDRKKSQEISKKVSMAKEQLEEQYQLWEALDASQY